MILESRKWRLVLRLVALVITSVLMLAFAGPVSYALKDDTPKAVTGPGQLYDEKGMPSTDAYVNARGVPDLGRAFAVTESGETEYWIPLAGYGGELFVRTESPSYVLPHDMVAEKSDRSIGSYAGKITVLKNRSNADDLVEEMAARGFRVDKAETMVLLQGESPSNYRPMVPVMPVLAWLWLVALVGMYQIWRGRHPRRRDGRLSRSARTYS